MKRLVSILSVITLLICIAILPNETLGGITTPIYVNANINTGATAKNGTAAPAGKFWSETQNNNGNLAESNGTIGVGCQLIGATTNNRCADDFVVPVGQSWTVAQVVTFGYQTGFAGAVSPFVSANLRIWNGRPGDPGAAIIFGDTTTNRLASSVDSNMFRTSNTVVPTPVTPLTNRIIWQNTMTVSPGLVLAPGTYWVDWQTDAGASGNFTPASTPVGTRGGPYYNSRQFIGTTSIWGDALDSGNPVAAPDYKLDFPFLLFGTTSGTTPNRAKTVDTNNDGKTDYVVATAASAVGQTEWKILNSAAATSGAFWGVGVGFPTGDKPTPADFDGDGRTDIAVWRAGAQANYYILLSATNTVRTDPFGQTSDDPSVVGDYDGDGKADTAVYRSGAQSFFYYRGSLNMANITFVPFGTTGDKAYPGDFDGDGKYDPSVYRNSGGNAVFYHRKSSTNDGSFLTNTFGLFADLFAPGDYDGDGRTDICDVRNESGGFVWYINRSSNNALMRVAFGNPATDYITQGDYDGDKRTDISVWRSGTGADRGNFFTWQSTGLYNATPWGASSAALTPTDYPVANFNVR